MNLQLSATYTAISPGLQSSVAAQGGSSPYTYGLLPNGVGGTINSGTGIYIAPSPLAGSSIIEGVDIVTVTDAINSTAQLQIAVGGPLFLLADVIRTQMGLSQQQIWNWNQKQDIPTDGQIYITLAALTPKVFGSSNKFDPASGNQIQSVNMLTNVQIDILSRSMLAFYRKEEVIMAFDSIYARQQMSANSFSISRASNNFVNLSAQDGDAILYRYMISVNLQYVSQKSVVAPYYSTFSNPVVNYVQP